jgi:hypothetical protein
MKKNCRPSKVGSLTQGAVTQKLQLPPKRLPIYQTENNGTLFGVAGLEIMASHWSMSGQKKTSDQSNFFHVFLKIYVQFTWMVIMVTEQILFRALGSILGSIFCRIKNIILTIIYTLVMS